MNVLVMFILVSATVVFALVPVYSKNKVDILLGTGLIVYAALALILMNLAGLKMS